MTNKPRLLIWGDSPAISTGFGVVLNNLCNYLHNDFEIGVLGINHSKHHPYDSSKYTIFKVSEQDQLGFERFGEIVEIMKPDVILLFQDIFHIYTMKSKYKEIFDTIPHVIYFPIDGRPFSKVWVDILKAPGVITYTEWGRKILQEALPEITDIEILPHGIDTSVFRPLPLDHITKYKRDLGWEDKFVITNVNRYQPRKHINQTLRIASMLINGHKVCKCGNIYPLHLLSCDLNDCSEKNLEGIYPGNKDMALYLHMNIVEPVMGNKPSDWLTSHAANNGFSRSDAEKHIFLNQSRIYDKESEPTQEELNILYNASDIMVSTSLGEGFGFSTAEAMATGTQVAVGRHSANIDITDNGKYGKLVPNIALFNWGRDSGQVRPIINPAEMMTAINEEYEVWLKNDRKKIIHHELVQRINDSYLWKDKAEKLTQILFKQLKP